MKVVDKGLRGKWLAEALAGFAEVGGQQRPPSRFHHPVDNPPWVGLPQRRDCRQGVQNVAHGAKPNHKQAKLGLRVQTLIFSQGWVSRDGRNAASQPVHGGWLVLDFNMQGSDLQRQRSH